MSEKAIQPPKPKKLKTEDCVEKKKYLVVVIEGASLEAAKVGNDYVILSSEKHATFLSKNKKDPADYRPDILHQCLLNLLDSPLNRAGLLQVYVHTAANVLIEISPQCRLPRTFDRFCGLMVQLLYKLVIRSADSSQKLLRVIKNPVNDHLPVGCRKLLTSFAAEKLTVCSKIVDPVSEEPIVVVIGGIARGKIETDYTDEEIKISNNPQFEIMSSISSYRSDASGKPSSSEQIRQERQSSSPLPTVRCVDSHEGFLVFGEEKKKIAVNKQSLASLSPYFDRLFFGDFAEKNMREIPIGDVEYEEFSNIIKMIYGLDGARVTGENVHRVMELADRFQLKIVVDRVEQFLIDSTDVYVREKKRIAQMYSLHNLEADCSRRAATAAASAIAARASWETGGMREEMRLPGLLN